MVMVMVVLDDRLVVLLCLVSSPDLCCHDRGDAYLRRTEEVSDEDLNDRENRVTCWKCQLVSRDLNRSVCDRLCTERLLV